MGHCSLPLLQETETTIEINYGIATSCTDCIIVYLEANQLIFLRWCKAGQSVWDLKSEDRDWNLAEMLIYLISLNVQWGTLSIIPKAQSICKDSVITIGRNFCIYESRRHQPPSSPETLPEFGSHLKHLRLPASLPERFLWIYGSLLRCTTDITGWCRKLMPLRTTFKQLRIRVGKETPKILEYISFSFLEGTQQDWAPVTIATCSSTCPLLTFLLPCLTFSVSSLMRPWITSQIKYISRFALGGEWGWDISREW